MTLELHKGDIIGLPFTNGKPYDKLGGYIYNKVPYVSQMFIVVTDIFREEEQSETWIHINY